MQRCQTVLKRRLGGGDPLILRSFRHLDVAGALPLATPAVAAVLLHAVMQRHLTQNMEGRLQIILQQGNPSVDNCMSAMTECCATRVHY